MDMQLNKLTKLNNDLLDISKMQTGKLVFQEELFDMDALVRETVETLQAVTQTHCLVIEQTESALVYGDKDRIGLHISSEIIKRHAGSLWVESTKGKGSTFHFILPLQSGNKTLLH